MAQLLLVVGPNIIKMLAIELAFHNINVNAVCPTTVDTGIVNNQAFLNTLQVALDRMPRVNM